MPSESITPQTGYYGKIPSQGDFVKYNLPREFIEPWDDWLQIALASSRSQLGDAWLTHYLTSPIYRFVLTPGVCGMSSWMGIFMPSVDRVGRYFPLTIATKIPSGNNPINALLDFEPWFNEVETLSLSSLEDGFDIASFSTLLAGLEQPFLQHKNRSEDATFHSKLHSQVQTPQLAIHLLSENTKSFQDNVADLLYAISIETCFSVSLWSTTGSDTVAPSLLCTQGLPPINSMVALYDGNWERWGWLSNDTGMRLPANHE